MAASGVRVWSPHTCDAPVGHLSILEEVTGVPHPLNKPLDSSRIHSIRMGI